MPGKCSFQDGWLKNEQYQQWLLKDVADVSMAKCAICRKSFSIASILCKVEH